MALETLKDVKEIGGFKVSLAPVAKLNISPFDHNKEPVVRSMTTLDKVTIDNTQNAICFRIQAGPIKENGVNGCQVSTLIDAAYHMIRGLNEKFPCDENEDTLHYLRLATIRQRQRTKNREARGVEGTSEV